MRPLLFPAGGAPYLVASFGLIGAAILIARWRVGKAVKRTDSN